VSLPDVGEPHVEIAGHRLLFGEALSPVKITGIVLVMAGLVVLKIGTG
jgi:multidrug transporter EmrE-like cation transporter